MVRFYKQCEICNYSYDKPNLLYKLSNDKWVCIACVEEHIEQTWLDWEEQRQLGEEE